MNGRAWKFGDDVNTDEIIPARYLNTTDAKELASHCMEDADASFAKKVKKGDIIAAGKNFGCGSSREHAPIAIKAAGVACVVAETFARIFCRNAINIGLPIFECPDAARAIADGDEVSVDMAKGEISVRGAVYTFPPYPDALKEIIEHCGLMPYVKERLKQ